MPTVPVDRSYLEAQLVDPKYKDEETFDQLMMDFGAEYDGVEVDAEGVEKLRVEVAANRYDLLCNEGIAQAFRTFLSLEQPPAFKLSKPKFPVTIKVDNSVASVRPVLVAAILRDVTLDAVSYASFIDLQDKLHHNICRRRQLVSIGTHDLTSIQGPFVYSAQAPKDIKFAPLNQTEVMDGKRLMEFYSEHAQLKQYLHIIRDGASYPVIHDSKGNVLSLPPIINGDLSKMSKDTKDILIEVTAIDTTKAKIVLDCLVAAFSTYCKNRFEIEPVTIRYGDSPAFGSNKSATRITPSLEKKTFTTSLEYIQKFTGIPNLSADIVRDTLNRMSLQVVKVKGSQISVACPITRSDILHECDLAEDVAIAYGFNNLPKKLYPPSSEQPIQALNHQVRRLIAECGYNEILNWALCSINDNFRHFGIKNPTELQACGDKNAYIPFVKPIETDAAKTKEFEIVRTHLLGGMLKCLHNNKAAQLPIRLFEVGTTCSVAPEGETRSINRTYVGALYSGNDTAGFEQIHGLLDTTLMKLQLLPAYADVMEGVRLPNSTSFVYRLENKDDPAFIKNRSIAVIVKTPTGEDVQIGKMGIIKPEILRTFGIHTATSCFEVTLQPFLDWLPRCDIFDE